MSVAILRAAAREFLPHPMLRRFRAIGSSFLPWSRIHNRGAQAVDKPLVVYLARRLDGLGVFGRFIESYKKFPDETPHDLLIIFKGFSNGELKAPYYQMLNGVSFLEIDKSDTGFDIGSFRKACEQFSYAYYLFLGSFCRILSSNYLTKLLNGLQSAPRAGVVGPSGSWERGVAAAFPNYHVRTCSFLMCRRVLAQVRWPIVLTKADAWEFEHGARGLSQQVMGIGLEPYIVRSDGRWCRKEEWPTSETFRSAEQAQLMIADKWSDLWASGDKERRRNHELLAWGPQC